MVEFYDTVKTLLCVSNVNITLMKEVNEYCYSAYYVKITCFHVLIQ